MDYITCDKLWQSGIIMVLCAFGLTVLTSPLPLSTITPPFKHTEKRGLKENLFERGLGGENPEIQQNQAEPLLLESLYKVVCGQ